MQDAPSLKTLNRVHLLPSLAVADMQSDRQKSAGQKEERGEDRSQCRAKGGKANSGLTKRRSELVRESVMDAGLFRQKRPD